MSKVYEVKDGDKIIKIKANGLCDLEEKLMQRDVALNFKRSDNISGTCLKGYITTTYDNLLSKLPKPIDNFDDYKCDVEWGLEFPDGTKATIYNYKNGRNYLGDNGKDKEDITQWNIGGTSHKAVEYVSEILGVKGEEFKI